MMKWIRDLFGVKNPPSEILLPRRDAVLFKTGGGWGDSILWYPRYDATSNIQRVVGWKTPIPLPGDVLIGDMKSGRIGVWIFQKVDRQTNPADMFLANVLAVGHADNINFCLPELPKSWIDCMREAYRS